MAPTLNILPHCTLELRLIRDYEHLHGECSNWLLCSRDDRARPMWEVVLSAPMLHALLECLAEGNASASIGSLQLQIYPDAELEESILNWANQQLARYASGFSLPPHQYGGSLENARMRLL